MGLATPPFVTVPIDSLQITEGLTVGAFDPAQ
jgi:hypothetical protein